MPIMYSFPTSFLSKVVGTTYRPALPWGELRAGDRLALVWEVDNAFGPRFDATRAQAVMVVHERTGAHIGYLGSTDRNTAAIVCAHLHAQGVSGGPAGCVARATIAELTGGTAGKENRGINIEVTLDRADTGRTPKQVARFYAIADACGLEREDTDELLTQYGVAEVIELSREDYDDLTNIVMPDMRGAA